MSALCLLVAMLAGAPDAQGASTERAAPTPTATQDPVTTAPAIERPGSTRLALRDPFEHGAVSPQPFAPVSPDLVDPFAHAAPRTAPPPPRDLRDPFVDGATRRCVPRLGGVPLQRPRQLPQTQRPCEALDRPLRNPFVAPTTPTPPGDDISAPVH